MGNNILLVDDSATIRAMVRRMLGMIELDIAHIYEASNGIEALAQLADHEVAMVLVDINMPIMNGVKLLTSMKKSERLQDIPVVVASTEGSQTRIEQLRTLGVTDYIRKPFRPEQLREVLSPILGDSEHESTQANDAGNDSF